MSKESVVRKISFPLEAVFHSAVQDSDNVELWRILLDEQVTMVINHANHAGLTPLHHTVLNNNIDGVKMLLSNGADANKADVNGFTPLHTASACGYLQVASFLILFGADVFAMTHDGDLALDLAKDSVMTQMLLDNMICHLHKQTYLSSWLLYQLREICRTFWHVFWDMCKSFQSYIYIKIANYQEQRRIAALQNDVFVQPKDKGTLQKTEGLKRD